MTFFYISESIIARELIPTGICCMWRGEHDGTIEIISRATIFFSKWLPYRKNVSFVRNRWNLIYWGNLTLRTWWYYQNFVTSKNINFVWFQWKLISWGSLTWRTWWYMYYQKVNMMVLSKCFFQNENWYLGVYWCGDYDGTLENFSKLQFSLAHLAMKWDIYNYL